MRPLPRSTSVVSYENGEKRTERGKAKQRERERERKRKREREKKREGVKQVDLTRSMFPLGEACHDRKVDP